MGKITNVVVRMYRMGTGDCFILKFLAGEDVQFKLMIDCGTWSGSQADLTKYITDLKAYVENHIDVLVITHEHKDHVHGFDVCRELLKNNFSIDRIWMGWPENDKNTKVKKWKKDYGDKKKALAMAAQKLQSVVSDNDYQLQMKGEQDGGHILHARQQLAAAIAELNELQNNVADGEYVGALAGMKVVKEDIAKDNIEYFSPGDIIEKLDKLDGIKMYVLGPPLSWENEAKVQEGKKGESYEHNNKLSGSDAFAAAILSQEDGACDATPFDKRYLSDDKGSLSYKAYHAASDAWRRIDTDWLNSAGSLALRINSITNNLSLALAIEFEDSGRVLLFPGDAEYGSWASWHNIPWEVESRKEDLHFTADLLDRTVFYKVAHHLSHHGTAERLGLNMMNHPDLVAMATLDYDVISSKWLGTMPNYALLKALVAKTKGRLLIMNENGVFYDKDKSVEVGPRLMKERKKMTPADLQAFENAYEEDDLYLQFTVSGE